MIHSRFIYTLIALSSVAMFSSCRAKRQATANTDTQVVYSSQSDIKAKLSGYDMHWEKTKVPITLRLKSPKNLSVSGQALMERGKCITISLKFIGMEIGLVHLTPDSVIAMDKYNKRYISESLGKFLSGAELNITNVQDVITGCPFLLGSPQPFSTVLNKFEIESPAISGGNYSLIPKQMPTGVEYGFSLSPAMQLAALIIKAGSNQPVTVSYSAPVTTTYGNMSPSVTVKATSGKTEIEAAIEWGLGKAKWDKDVQMRTVSIPKGYERIDAKKLLKGLSNM